METELDIANLPSEIMPGSEEGDGDQRAIKRIRQACANCRRKKVRCSGDRPICSFCRRLSQSCCYNDEPSTKRAESALITKSNQDELSSKVLALESQLKELTDFMKSSQGPWVERSPASQAAAQPSLPKQLPAQELCRNKRSLPAASDKFQTTPPPSIMATLIDDYFLHCHNEPYALFHERTFRERLRQDEVPKYLMYVLLASAVRYSTHPYFAESQAEAMEKYASRSWALVVNRWHGIDEEIELDIIRAMVLHSVIDFTGGKRHRAWIKIGLTIRICQDLGLIHEPEVTMDAIEKEDRRRIFWSTYLLDRFVSCNRRRPCGILDDDCTVRLPSCDSMFEAGQESLCPTLSQIEGSDISDPSPFAISVSIASLLSRTIRYNLYSNTKGTTAPPWDPTSDFASISSKLAFFESRFRIGDPIHPIVTLSTCEGNSPPENRNPGYIVLGNVLWNLCQCLLNHPLLLLRKMTTTNSNGHGRRKFLRRAIESAIEYTTALSELLRDTEAAGCAINTSIYGYCAMVSSTILILQINASDESHRHKAEELLQSNKKLLGKLSHSWPSAFMMQSSLENFQADSTRYANILDIDNNLDIDSIDVSNLDEFLDYDTLSSTVVKARRSEAVAVSPTSWPYVSWMDFDASSLDLLSYPTPSEECSNQAVDHALGMHEDIRFGTDASPAGAEMSPLSLFLIGQGSR